jgi:hypothetical protein
MGITLAFYRTHSSTDPFYRAMTAPNKFARLLETYSTLILY